MAPGDTPAGAGWTIPPHKIAKKAFEQNMSAHAEMGPSGAERWMTCTSSVALIAALKECLTLPEFDESDDYSSEGTGNHDVRAECLETGADPFDYVGKTIHVGKFSYQFDEDMAEALIPGIDWLRERLDKIDVELRVRLDPWMPNQFGTLDSGGVFEKTLLICDYKNGAGEAVDAVQNKQLMLYALGYWHHIGRPEWIERVLLVIDQPHAGGMKFWELTLDELKDFGRAVSEVYLRIKTGNTQFQPSRKACRWCPVKTTEEGCRAYNRWMLDLFLGAFDKVMLLLSEPQFEDPDLITPEQRWFIIQHSDLAKQWLSKLYEDALAAAEDGRPDPGSKAVMGRRGNRFLRDMEKATDILWDVLGPDTYAPLKVIGITEIEKRLKPGRRKPGNPEAWAEIQKLIEQGEGKPTLVREDDPRPAVTALSDEFEDLDG